MATKMKIKQANLENHLPNSVTNTSGVILAIRDQMAMIKFENFVNEAIKINSYAFLPDKSFLLDNDIMETFNIGYPITFHAVLNDNEQGKYQQYFVTSAFLSGSQQIKEKFMKKVSKGWEDEWKKRHDLNRWSGLVTAFVDSIDGYTQKLPCMLQKCVAEVVKISRDVRLSHYVTIFKIERFDVASYAQYISENQWHSDASLHEVYSQHLAINLFV